MVSMATPTYRHLKDNDFNRVYEPAEDTFLMMDALEKDVDVIRNTKPLICLEIGPGSGVLITFLAQLIGNTACYFASDINFSAAIATKETSKENMVEVDCMTDESISSLKKRLKSSVDVLLFNPPYVVTPSEEVGSTGIEASWAGGTDGREVIDKMLPIVASLMTITGVFYLVLIEQNKPDDVIKTMTKYGYYHRIVMKRRSGPEYLLVIRFSKTEMT